jgi:hypothetical protein
MKIMLNVGTAAAVKGGASMSGISQEAKMIIASNLTVAAVIKEAALAMKSGPQTADTKVMVTGMYAAILAEL